MCVQRLWKRERFGDWEVDTILGKHGSGALVTLAERKRRLYLVRKVETKVSSMYLVLFITVGLTPTFSALCLTGRRFESLRLLPDMCTIP